jgi:hypothetical protein
MSSEKRTRVNLGVPIIEYPSFPGLATPCGTIQSQGTVQVSVQPVSHVHSNGIKPRPASEEVGIYIFSRKEVISMWVLLGRVLFLFAKLIGITRLYTTSRHSFRNIRPELVFVHWRYFGKEGVTSFLNWMLSSRE